MTSLANEVDEFSSLFEFDGVDGYVDDIFESVCGDLSTPANSTIKASINNTLTSNFKVPSLSSHTGDVKVECPPKHVSMFPFMVNGFKFQPANLPLAVATNLTDLKGNGKRKSTQDAEERRMKNRESADKSRLKKRELLQTLPARNAELEARVQTLECGLAASRAEAETLREQCNFLKTLLSNKQATTNHTGVSVSPDYEPSLVPHTTQGVLLLAVCCILTVNQWGVLMDSYPDSQVLHNGGRILLSTGLDEESSMFSGSSMNGWYLFSMLVFCGVCLALRSVRSPGLPSKAHDS